jgi:methyl-accepting chemotaxis protein
VVIVQQDRAELFAGLHRAFWRAAIIAAVILLGVMSVSIVLSRGISTPLKNLTAAVKQVADGALGTPVPGTEREDEIGELAKATEVFRENALRMEQMNEEQR